ncbi:hypothetical protein [Streptomyces sp. MW-W600-10]|uniref:hypothetical protein n=1 Tax=Streptomyces sp. MW-W600-10 TaxID=2829819 RepID=UPI0027E45448|nr:hypothetical protein [Streptomyces sp. MW-W600-10]
MSSPTRLRVRLLLAFGAAEVHLRLSFSGLMRVLARRPARPVAPFAELVRIESDPAYRALFFAELDEAIESRHAARMAMVEEVEVAAERLRSLIRAPDSRTDADERAA